jgi:protein required for attachment to host cells
MQIPQNIIKPKKTTMLVVADTQTAILYLVKDDGIEQVKKIFFPEERASDKEGGFAQHGKRGQLQSFGNPPVVPDEGHLLKDRLCKELSDELFQRFQNKEFEQWYLVAPDYVLGTIKDEMHSYLQEALKKILELNLINESPLDILKRLQK